MYRILAGRPCTVDRLLSPRVNAVSQTPTSRYLSVAPPPTLEHGNVQTPDYGYNVSGLDRGPGPGDVSGGRPRIRSATLGRAVGKDTTPTASRASPSVVWQRFRAEREIGLIEGLDA